MDTMAAIVCALALRKTTAVALRALFCRLQSVCVCVCVLTMYNSPVLRNKGTRNWQDRFGKPALAVWQIIASRQTFRAAVAALSALFFSAADSARRGDNDHSHDHDHDHDDHGNDHCNGNDSEAT